MKSMPWVFAAAILLSGCVEQGSGTFMGVRFAEPDAWIVTTVETELDRSNVPDAGTIHTYDASVIVDVAKVDLAMGKSSARLNDQPT